MEGPQDNTASSARSVETEERHIMGYCGIHVSLYILSGRVPSTNTKMSTGAQDSNIIPKETPSVYRICLPTLNLQAKA